MTFPAPSEAPSGVSVSAGAAGELHVSWRAPPRDAWHGELLGYSVTCAELGPDSAPIPNATRYLYFLMFETDQWTIITDTYFFFRTLTVNGWSASELTLSALKKFTRYEVRVRAFNGIAAGPPSVPVTATTLEGGNIDPDSDLNYFICTKLT